jgi:endonuclease/exonuclease/phosphatase family metal-dependent hydrolase
MGARLLAVFIALGLMGCAVDTDEESVGESAEAISDLHRFKVITHNIAGGMIHYGNAKALDYVDAEIEDFKPDVVLLQEVCVSQLEAFKTRHPSWDVHFSLTRPVHPKCATGGASLGQLIAAPKPFEDVDEYDLGDAEPDGSKKYTLLCGNVKLANRKDDVRTCSTHLVAKGDDAEGNLLRRARQAKRIVDAVKPRIRDGEAVVMGGDFNAGPWRPVLDTIYRISTTGGDGDGAFDEADQTDARREQYAEKGVKCGPDACRSGQNTHDESKLDHVFFSHNRVGRDVDGEVRGKGGSDHNLYRAFAQLKLRPKK